MVITVFGAEVIASLNSCLEFVLGRESWLNTGWRRRKSRRKRERKRRRGEKKAGEGGEKRRREERLETLS